MIFGSSHISKDKKNLENGENGGSGSLIALKALIRGCLCLVTLPTLPTLSLGVATWLALANRMLADLTKAETWKNTCMFLFASLVLLPSS